MQNPTFSPELVTQIRDMCNLIYSVNRKGNVKDRKQDSVRSGEEINLQGIGAEVWLRALHGLPLLLDDISPRSYKEDKDIILDGLHCEVKQTSYKTGAFFIKHKNWYGKERELLADVYILVVGSFPLYEYAKYIVRDNLLYQNPCGPTMHKRIGAVGFHVEQNCMHDTIKGAIKWNIPTTNGL